MKIALTVIFLTLLRIGSYSQDTFTSRKGSRFFPGHLEVVITVDHHSVRYELFNHWYTHSYAELRQITIPLDSLNIFNQNNDSINIILHEGRIKLVDRKYGLSKNVKHVNSCASASTMRKISFAYNISGEHQDIRHYELYEREDLILDEEEFRKKVLTNLEEKIREVNPGLK